MRPAHSSYQGRARVGAGVDGDGQRRVLTLGHANAVAKLERDAGNLNKVKGLKGETSGMSTAISEPPRASCSTQQRQLHRSRNAPNQRGTHHGASLDVDGNLGHVKVLGDGLAAAATVEQLPRLLLQPLARGKPERFLENGGAASGVNGAQPSASRHALRNLRT